MLPILIVDDEPAIAALISRVLTAAGYTCQAVTSSEKAAAPQEPAAEEVAAEE